MKTITQEELNEKISMHEQWLRNESTGKRLWLRNCDLRGMDLSEKNLRDSILAETNLSGTDFRETVLTNANLYGSDFTKAVLTGSILIRANLTDTTLIDAVLNVGIGNGIEIKTLQTGYWTTSIIFPTKILQIGCEQIGFNEFFKITKKHADEIQPGSGVWVKDWRPVIEMVINKARWKDTYNNPRRACRGQTRSIE